MRLPWRRKKDGDDVRPPSSMPREIEMMIVKTGKRYPLVPFYVSTDDEGVTMWKVGLHPDVDGDVFITETTGPVALRAKVLPARCAMAIGFAQEDDDRIRIMRHDELRDHTVG
jgi:hypothetical protein